MGKGLLASFNQIMYIFSIFVVIYLLSDEANSGPYYTHLGHGASVQEVRRKMERQSGLQGDAIRIEKACFVPKEGKGKHGCPVAKYVIKRCRC